MPTFKLADSPYIKRVVGTFGDVNMLDYDGGFVFVHAQGDTFDWEFVQTPTEGDWDCKACWGNPDFECGDKGCKYEDECPGNGDAVCVVCKGTGKNPDLRWTVYRGLVEEPDWANYSDVARTCGQTAADYHAAFAFDEGGDERIMRRMRVLEDVASHYGWHELDHEPIEFSYTEIHERYKGFDAQLLLQKELAAQAAEETRLQEKYG